jgi:hypothetical protein
MLSSGQVKIPLSHLLDPDEACVLTVLSSSLHSAAQLIVCIQKLMAIIKV